MFEKRFENRKDAGKRLAKILLEYRGKDAVVFAIPRGGVVIAYEIVKLLGASLDIIIPRKIGALGNQELAIGAVTEDGTTILNTRLVNMLDISEEYIETEKAKQIKEIKRRIKTYRGDQPQRDLEGKIVILVDDGIAVEEDIDQAMKLGANFPEGPFESAKRIGLDKVKEEMKKLADELGECYSVPKYVG